MSRAEIDRFVGDVRANRKLLEELSDGVIGLGHFVDKAKQRGYRFTVEEAKGYIREIHGSKVTDASLERVAGGVSVTNTNVATQAEAVTAAVELSHAATTTNAAGEVEVVAVGVIVAT